jgi:hypothetical protein
MGPRDSPHRVSLATITPDALTLYSSMSLSVEPTCNWPCVSCTEWGEGDKAFARYTKAQVYGDVSEAQKISVVISNSGTTSCQLGIRVVQYNNPQMRF